MVYAKDYTTTELMAATTARQIKNGDVVIVGIGIPLMAGYVAANTHAPNALIVYEGGGIGAISKRIPFSISDNATTDNALAVIPMWKILSDCQRGFVTLGITGGAEIDRFGNLNSTKIPDMTGSSNRPKIRLAGSGGANDIASGVPRTIIMMRLQKGKFVNKVKYITSPGYLSGPGEREKAGLKGKGPEMVITDYGTFKFDEDTKEMYLDAVFPGINPEQVKELVEWDLKISPNLAVVEPPTEEQVGLMRGLDPAGMILRGQAAGPKSETFDDYFENMQKAYNLVNIKL